MTYFLFRFDQSKEDRVRRRAGRFNIEVIAPRVTTWRKAANKRKPSRVSVPAYHSYLILGFEHEQITQALTGLDASVRPLLVPYNGKDWTLARVPDADVEAIRSNRMFKGASAAGLIEKVVPDPKYGKDELVRILGGAATGLEGRIISADPKTREAELDMENWPAKLRVSYDLLERAA
jgi:hypothetical protein